MNAPNDQNSIIMDWFKRNGMDASYSARTRFMNPKIPCPYCQRLFSGTGTGTSQQNIVLLEWLKNNFGL